MHIRSGNFNHLKPLRFDFYVLSEVLGAFVGSSVFILFILLMFQVLRLAEFFIVHGASLATIGKMTFFMSVSFLPAVLPLSFLIALLIAFGRLSTDSELIAMKANGISIWRLTVPLLFVSIIVVALSLALNIEWVPNSMVAFRKLHVKMGNTKIVSAIKEGTFNAGFFDLLLFADKVDTQNNHLHRVFIFDEREPNNPLTYVSKEAEIVPVKTNSDIGAAIMLRLYEGSMHHNNATTQTYEKMDFESYHLYLKISEGADPTYIGPSLRIQRELIENIKKTSPESQDGREFRGEYWRRYATALSPLIFVFLGIGFGTSRNRTAKAGAVLTGLGVLIVYWVLQTAGSAILLQGTLPAWAAMQLPNVAMVVGAIFGYRRAAW